MPATRRSTRNKPVVADETKEEAQGKKDRPESPPIEPLEPIEPIEPLDPPEPLEPLRPETEDQGGEDGTGSNEEVNDDTGEALVLETEDKVGEDGAGSEEEVNDDADADADADVKGVKDEQEEGGGRDDPDEKDDETPEENAMDSTSKIAQEDKPKPSQDEGTENDEPSDAANPTSKEAQSKQSKSPAKPPKFSIPSTVDPKLDSEEYAERARAAREYALAGGRCIGRRKSKKIKRVYVRRETTDDADGGSKKKKPKGESSGPRHIVRVLTSPITGPIKARKVEALDPETLERKHLFPKVSDAANAMGISYTRIYRACRQEGGDALGDPPLIYRYIEGLDVPEDEDIDDATVETADKTKKAGKESKSSKAKKRKKGNDKDAQTKSPRKRKKRSLEAYWDKKTSSDKKPSKKPKTDEKDVEDLTKDEEENDAENNNDTQDDDGAKKEDETQKADGAEKTGDADEAKEEKKPRRSAAKGCNCKSSQCLNLYCVCYEVGIPCRDKCKCIECLNPHKDPPPPPPPAPKIAKKRGRKKKDNVPNVPPFATPFPFPYPPQFAAQYAAQFAAQFEAAAKQGKQETKGGKAQKEKKGKKGKKDSKESTKQTNDKMPVPTLPFPFPFMPPNMLPIVPQGNKGAAGGKGKKGKKDSTKESTPVPTIPFPFPFPQNMPPNMLQIPPNMASLKNPIPTLPPTTQTTPTTPTTPAPITTFNAPPIIIGGAQVDPILLQPLDPALKDSAAPNLIKEIPLQSNVAKPHRNNYPSGVLHTFRSSTKWEQSFVWIANKSVKPRSSTTAIDSIAKVGKILDTQNSTEYIRDRVVFIPYTSKEKWMQKYPHAVPTMECDKEANVSGFPCWGRVRGLGSQEAHEKGMTYWPEFEEEKDDGKSDGGEEEEGDEDGDNSEDENETEGDGEKVSKTKKKRKKSKKSGGDKDDVKVIIAGGQRCCRLCGAPRNKQEAKEMNLDKTSNKDDADNDEQEDDPNWEQKAHEKAEQQVISEIDQIAQTIDTLASPITPTTVQSRSKRNKYQKGPKLLPPSSNSVLDMLERDLLHIEMYKYFKWLLGELQDMDRTTGGRRKMRTEKINLEGVEKILEGLKGGFGCVGEFVEEERERQEQEERERIEREEQEVRERFEQLEQRVRERHGFGNQVPTNEVHNETGFGNQVPTNEAYNDPGFGNQVPTNEAHNETRQEAHNEDVQQAQENGEDGDDKDKEPYDEGENAEDTESGLPFLEEVLGFELRQLADIKLQAKAKQNVGDKRGFDEFFEDMVAYKEKHGNANIPNSYKPDRKIVRWIQQLRIRYKSLQDKGKLYESDDELKEKAYPAMLTRERLDKLTSIGFQFVGREGMQTWEESFQEVLEFYRENGHLKLPPTMRKLNKWLKYQRKMYSMKEKNFMEKRFSRLDALGMDWTPRRFTMVSWEDRLEQLKTFARINGHFEVPPPLVEPHEDEDLDSENNKAARFYRWVQSIHTEYRYYYVRGVTGGSRLLTDSRVEQLRQIGFEFR